ncbi:hypothetical protein EYF80_000261 [Liparis tanakae]|uniref:Uncharacterized protein n=1 Tax=Liparis tanakae TaxID=230148 RepID=A0A4Z2JJ42_9TELE|nr:hypothetical protein EYF80_000261 [Liparis tanakae]
MTTQADDLIAVTFERRSLKETGRSRRERADATERRGRSGSVGRKDGKSSGIAAEASRSLCARLTARITE